MSRLDEIVVPRYYRPWPHQVAAWQRRSSGQYNFYFKLWARQLGKDTDDIQHSLDGAWNNPGTQTAYVGLDNVWVSNNIFKKYIDGRKHWDDYPEDLIEVKETQKEVFLLNNPPDKAPSRIKFIGFLNDQQLIGSSYDRFYISEASLYERHAFAYIRPIWDRKLGMGLPLSVNFNGTPRGTRNVFYDLLRTYTGVDDPSEFPGEHGNCFVDKVTIRDAVMPDGNGGWKKMYSDEDIEKLKSQYLREFGNLNFYYQENECNFTTVNAGLVYQGIEQLQNEKRFIPFNVDTHKPVYIACDIASKDKVSDATAVIVFQYVNGMMFVYDIMEERGKALIEVISELSKKDYFKYIRFAALPWDSERSASSKTPKEEAEEMFPSINWHSLDKERVDRGIAQVRRMLPNMVINSTNCDRLMDAFNNYEYSRLEKKDDWAAKPQHNWASHLMDAMRYAVMSINEIQYLQLNDDGSDRMVGGYYTGFGDDDYEEDGRWRITQKRREKRTDGGLYYYG